MILMACYNSDAASGEVLLQPIRTLARPLVDTFRLLPYSEIATIANDPIEQPPIVFHLAAASFQEILPADVDVILDKASDPSSGLMQVEVRHLGGAVYARMSEETIAFHFSANFALFLVAAAPEREALEVGKRSLDAIVRALQPKMAGEVLLNLMAGNDVSVERTRAAFPPASYQRLVELKDRYDPENTFRFNQNIPPSYLQVKA